MDMKRHILILFLKKFIHVGGYRGKE
jgi:hypothetical protein